MKNILFPSRSARLIPLFIMMVQVCTEEKEFQKIPLFFWKTTEKKSSSYKNSRIFSTVFLSKKKIQKNLLFFLFFFRKTADFF